jgi:uncharacterized protein
MKMPIVSIMIRLLTLKGAKVKAFWSLIVLATLFQVASAQENEPLSSVSVTGVGTVKVTPDIGYITLGVITKKDKSSEAVKSNSQAMFALNTVLNSKGVKASEIQTTDFSVHEAVKIVYDKEDRDRANPKRVTEGFVVNNTVQVTICDLSKFGEILDAATASDTNVLVNSIRFGSNKSEEATKKARAEAMEIAKSLVKEFGNGLGFETVKVLSVQEDAMRPRQSSMYSSSNDMELRAVPIGGGSLTYSVSVTVRWEIKQKK